MLDNQDDGRPQAEANHEGVPMLKTKMLKGAKTLKEEQLLKEAQTLKQEQMLKEAQTLKQEQMLKSTDAETSSA